MKILIHILLLPVVLLAQQSQNIPSLSRKPVHFLVVDQSGNPVGNALIEASRHGPGNATGYTNNEGELVLQLTKGASLHVYVSKDGYYNTGGELWTGGMYKGPGQRLVAREVPDTFTIELKKVINPIALHHYKYRGIAPKPDKPAGFDLQAGDWVAPHGKGSVTDILFHFHDFQADERGYAGTMTLLFPNPRDGIQSFQAARPFSRQFGSDLAPPAIAPTDGYLPSLVRTIRHRKGEPYSSSEDDNRHYLIRTRTRTDAGGIIRQACYGWIEGEIEFDPRDPRGPQLAFTCFFNSNPDPDARSLESIQHAPRSR